MRFLTLIEVLDLHHRIIQQSGGVLGIRDVVTEKHIIVR